MDLMQIKSPMMLMTIRRLRNRTIAMVIAAVADLADAIDPDVESAL